MSRQHQRAARRYAIMTRSYGGNASASLLGVRDLGGRLNVYRLTISGARAVTWFLIGTASRRRVGFGVRRVRAKKGHK